MKTTLLCLLIAALAPDAYAWTVHRRVGHVCGARDDRNPNPATPAPAAAPAAAAAPGATKLAVVEGFSRRNPCCTTRCRTSTSSRTSTAVPRRRTTTDSSAGCGRTRCREPQVHRGGPRRRDLNAPKGLAIRGDTLWVADIDMSDRSTRRPAPEGQREPGRPGRGIPERHRRSHRPARCTSPTPHSVRRTWATCSTPAPIGSSGSARTGK